MNILNAQATVAAGSAFKIAPSMRDYPRMVQVYLSGGSGSVRLQGRVSSDAPWVDLGTAFTASGMQTLNLPAEVRANVTAITGGNFSMWLDAREA